MWTDNYIERELPLLYFRADNAFIWQGRAAQEIQYVLTTLYAQQVDDLGLLDRLDEDDLFGNATVKFDESLVVSRDLLDSVLEIGFLERELGVSSRADLRVLDIGAGYGRLAYRLIAALPNLERVICTDAVAESTVVCEYYLGMRGCLDRCAVVPLDEITDWLMPGDVDLATNIHSFSEAPLDAIRWWLDLAKAKRIRYFLIVPNTEALLSTEPDGSRASFAGELQARGYQLRTKEPQYARAASVQRNGLYPSHYYLFELQE